MLGYAYIVYFVCLNLPYTNYLKYLSYGSKKF